MTLLFRRKWTIEGYERIVQPIVEGNTLYDVLSSIKDSIKPFADLENGYILRDSNAIPVNMLKLLYKSDLSEDIKLEAFDRITIPIDKPVVFVTGAVNVPGIYPYNPRTDFIPVRQPGGGV